MSGPVPAFVARLADELVADGHPRPTALGVAVATLRECAAGKTGAKPSVKNQARQEIMVFSAAKRGMEAPLREAVERADRRAMSRDERRAVCDRLSHRLTLAKGFEITLRHGNTQLLMESARKVFGADVNGNLRELVEGEVRSVGFLMEALGSGFDTLASSGTGGADFNSKHPRQGGGKFGAKGKPISTAPTAGKKKVKGNMAGTIGQAQQLLVKLGFNLGDLGVDGTLNPSTRAALMAFQKREGLPVTGAIDSGTLSLLNQGVARLSSKASKGSVNLSADQPSGAVTPQKGTPQAKPVAKKKSRLQEAAEAVQEAGAFNERLHPRGRGGKFTEVLGKLNALKPGHTAHIHGHQITRGFKGNGDADETVFARQSAGKLLSRGTAEEIADEITRPKGVVTAQKTAQDRHRRIENERVAGLEQGVRDWGSGRAYLDNAGNYRLRPEGMTSGKGGTVAPWNKHVKSMSNEEFHALAMQAQGKSPSGKPLPEAVTAKGLAALSDEELQPFIDRIMSYPDEGVRKLIAREGNKRIAVRRRDGTGSKMSRRSGHDLLIEASYSLGAQRPFGGAIPPLLATGMIDGDGGGATVEREADAPLAPIEQRLLWNDLDDLVDPLAEAVALRVAASEAGDSEAFTEAFAVEKRLRRDRDSLLEAADSMAKASTHEKVGHTGKGLWNHKGLQLPAYIQHIANDLREKRGMDTSRAIATAIAAVKRWARGGGKVDATTRAAAAKAVAEWEALKASHGGGLSESALPLYRVLSSAGKIGRFNASLHPRDRQGQWRDTPDLPVVRKNGKVLGPSPGEKRLRGMSSGSPSTRRLVGALNPGDKFEWNGSEYTVNGKGDRGIITTIKKGAGTKHNFNPTEYVNHLGGSAHPVVDPGEDMSDLFNRGMSSGSTTAWPGYTPEAQAYETARLADDLRTMPLSRIASMIQTDWGSQGKGVNFAAKPYLEAMGSLYHHNDSYGMDSGKSILAYFLSNASSYKGDRAKAVKAELKKRLREAGETAFVQKLDRLEEAVDLREAASAAHDSAAFGVAHARETTLREAVLTAASRSKIPKGDFAIPEERAYPIHDLSHARNALSRASGKPEEARVKAAVYRKYPQLKDAA